jgi:hypothetical protein
MEKEKQIDNQIFISTLVGVFLLIIAIAAAIISARHMTSNQVLSLLAPVVPGITACYLIYRAVRKNPKRWIQYN